MDPLAQSIMTSVTNAAPPTAALGQTIQNDMILKDVIAQSPVFSRLYNPNNTAIMFASPERVAANQTMGGGGSLEFWPQSEPGQPGFEHPLQRKKTVLEIYSPELQNDTNALKQAVYGDLLHGLVQDPKWASMRDEFSKNFTPQTINMLNRDKRPLNDSTVDAWIRGYLSPDQNNEFVRGQNSGQAVWSPKQIEILNQMKNYLNTGK